MAFQHSHIDVSSLDSSNADRKLMSERVLKRVRLSKATRALQTRLSLASFKAARGLHNVTFDVIEPYMMHIAEQQQRSNNTPLAQNVSPDRLHPRARKSTNPAPTTFVTPDRPFSHSVVHQAWRRLPSVTPPTFREFSHASLPLTDPVLRHIYRDPPASQPSLKRSLPEDVYQTPDGLPVTPTGSQEYLNAANVLRSLSRAPSSSSLYSASPLGWPRSCPPGLRSTSGTYSDMTTSQRSITPEGSPVPNRSHHPTKSLSELEEEEAQANAAELMLFLAAGSPSPTRRPAPETSTPSAQTIPDEAATSRRLFDMNRNRSPSPVAKDTNDATVAPPLSTSSQHSSRSANSISSNALKPEWLGLSHAPDLNSGSVKPCYEPSFEDLLQLASTSPERVVVNTVESRTSSIPSHTKTLLGRGMSTSTRREAQAW